DHWSGRNMLDGPHDRFFDLGLGKRKLTAIAHAGNQFVKLKSFILDRGHIGLLSVTPHAVGVAHGVVHGTRVGSAIDRSHLGSPGLPDTVWLGLVSRGPALCRTLVT